MLNQKTIDSLYHYMLDDDTEFEEENDGLYHHGVMGQSWGKRHGPPYPLGGIDKKIARAEARKKKEKERRLKKMQRAAKKARKEKIRNEKREADILKKKQKLVKEGNIDKIKKNSELFTNEELNYIMERENLKKGLRDKKERSNDEKMELVMKRMAQIGTIAVSAGQVLNAAKAGMDVVKSFKETKVKELEAEDKRMSALKSEFEMRFQGDERSSAEAKRFIDDKVNDRTYKPDKKSKIDKAEEKVVEDARRRQVEQYYEDMNKADKLKKENEKQAKIAAKQAKKEERRGEKSWKDFEKMQNKAMRDAEKLYREETNRYEGVENLRANGMLADRTKYSFGFKTPVSQIASSSDTTSGKKYVFDTSSRTKWSSKPVGKTFDSDSYAGGSAWVNSFMSSDWSGTTYQTQKGYKVTPQKKNKF